MINAILIFCLAFCSQTSSIYPYLKEEIFKIQKDSNRTQVDKNLNDLSEIAASLSDDQREEILSILQDKISLFPYLLFFRDGKLVNKSKVSY
ncbi:MAG: hypothetical protein H7A23_19805 [Leptospiraceae bacterium]|nr:hypothetical protein [Leptospiraceae bacterium]